MHVKLHLLLWQNIKEFERASILKNRIKILYALLIFLAAEAIQIIIVGGFSLVYGIMIAFRYGLEQGTKGNSKPQDITVYIENAMSQDLIYLISVIAVIVCGLVFFFWYKREIRGEVRGSIRKVFAFKNVVLLILLGIGSQFFISGMLSIAQKYFSSLFADYAKQMEQLTNGNYFVVLLLLVIIAPVTEELVFRGVILHKTNRYISFVGANIIQAVLFGIYHMNIIQGIYAAIIGLVLGAVYYKFKSIFTSMFLHMVLNTSSFLIMLFPDNSMSYFIFLFVGGILFVVTLYLLKPSDTLVPNEIMPEYNLEGINDNSNDFTNFIH